MKNLILLPLIILTISFGFSQKKTLVWASNGNTPQLDKEIANYIGEKMNRQVKTVVLPKVTQNTIGSTEKSNRFVFYQYLWVYYCQK